MAVASVHGVCPGGEGLARLAPVRRGARLFAVHYVRSDGKHRERVHGVAVQRVLFQLGREFFYDIYSLVVRAVIIVAVFREIALNGKIHRDALRVAHRAHPGPADSRKRICRH